MISIHARFYTDPACPWSWAFEPTLRRLMVEFGQTLQVEYVMAGMRAALVNPRRFAVTALDAADQSGMPVDVRLWLQDPPTSSHAACMGVKAAAEQGEAGRYLRRLREGFFCRGRKLDSAEALVAEARALPGLDLERFRIDLASHAVLELLGADLERARSAAPEHQSSEEGRVTLPSLEFEGPNGDVQGVYGYCPYEAVREAALRAGAAREGSSLSVDEALARFGVMATAEVAAICELPGPTAPAALWRLATEWRVKVERCGTGELWSVA